MPLLFNAFFFAATGHEPYDYQRRLACGERSRTTCGEPSRTTCGERPDGETDVTWLAHGADCQSRLINIPTGLGKTAAVVLAWLWNVLRRAQNGSPASQANWPRRLVYCLPMRTLVEQTEDEVKKWIGNLLAQVEALGLSPEARAELQWLAEHSPVVLMGGEELDEARRDWDIYPEKPAILIGTQDMLLSRALNRGYGMSRYRWPVHFGLLNNDALWVMDETQLMGPGLATACQLEAFRTSFGSIPGSRSSTWYMSATGDPEHLKTRDWRDTPRFAGFQFGLTRGDKAATSGPIFERRGATKMLKVEPDLNFGDGQLLGSTIASVLKKHQEMLAAIASNQTLPARTLIICNTVDRAVAVHAALNRQKPDGCDLLLLHSRFRPPERVAQMNSLKLARLADYPSGQIVVATQVIEAGVDVSSAVLWSEIAPLASLVQRLGRLNRSGEFPSGGWKPQAVIVGVGVQASPPRESKEEAKKREDKDAKCCLPYELAACESAWNSLRKLGDEASSANLELIQADIAASIPRCPYSLQRYELTDFFDTDANLSLGFTDVTPFVRGLDVSADLQVCWREPWSTNDVQPDSFPDYQRDELCPVSIREAKDARDILNHGWLWRGKESGWLSMRDIQPMPGMTILLPLTAGGYDNASGWTGDRADNKHTSHYRLQVEPSDEEQLSVLANGWQSIAVHTATVAHELGAIVHILFSPIENEIEPDALLSAASWHDVGKNHPAWQQAVLTALGNADITGKEANMPFAKFSLSDSPSLIGLEGETLKKRIRELRCTFRPEIAHEVASALAFRQAEQKRLGPTRDIDLASLLAEYVIMSHHGHVRKVLRDEIPRFPKDGKDNDTVRGVADGSAIPAVVIDGISLGCACLSTDSRRMGRDKDGHESYTRGVLRLLDHYGPFRLAFLESVFRAADVRASILARKQP